MQPICYFAARIVMSYFQLLERSNRAFTSTTPTTLAQGAAHCWAVLYALMISALMQSTRLTGSHDPDNIPRAVSLTESIASWLMLAWTWAGMGLLCQRFIQVDDQNMGLPVHHLEGDFTCFGILPAIRSPTARKVVQIMYTLSGAGLFVSVLLLAASILPNVGGTTVCDLCLLAVGGSFAVPHAVLAVRSMAMTGKSAFHNKMLTLAAEASAIGPQMCVIFCAADVLGEAPQWKSAVHVVATVAYLVGLFATTQRPIPFEGANTTPEVSTLACSAFLDFVAAILLGSVFQIRIDWLWWIVIALTLILLAVVSMETPRQAIVEIFEPIMPFRCDESKNRVPPWMKNLRLVVHLCAFASAAVALQAAAPDHAGQKDTENTFGDDIRRSSPPMFEGLDDQHIHNEDHAFHEDHDKVDDDTWEKEHHERKERHWASKDWLLVRWLPGSELEKDAIRAQAAKMLGLDDFAHVTLDSWLPQHRVAVFSVAGYEAGGDHKGKWTDAIPHESATDWLDKAFPAALDKAVCKDLDGLLWQHESEGDNVKMHGEQANVANGPLFAASASPLKAAVAYTAACNDVEDKAYGHDHDYDYEENYHEHQHDSWHDDDAEGLVTADDLPDSSHGQQPAATGPP